MSAASLRSLNEATQGKGEPWRKMVATSDISSMNVDMFSVRLSLAPI